MTYAKAVVELGNATLMSDTGYLRMKIATKDLLPDDIVIGANESASPREIMVVDRHWSKCDIKVVALTKDFIDPNEEALLRADIKGNTNKNFNLTPSLEETKRVEIALQWSILKDQVAKLSSLIDEAKSSTVGQNHESSDVRGYAEQSIDICKLNDDIPIEFRISIHINVFAFVNVNQKIPEMLKKMIPVVNGDIHRWNFVYSAAFLNTPEFQNFIEFFDFIKTYDRFRNVEYGAYVKIVRGPILYKWGNDVVNYQPHVVGMADSVTPAWFSEQQRKYGYHRPISW